MARAKPDQTLISVIVPTFNKAHLLKATIDSALQQSWRSLEVIVVDDASTDNTREVVDRLKDRDRRVSYIRLEENSNLPAVSRNVGIQASRGEFIAFLDHDDLWTRKKLDRQMRLFNVSADTIMVHGYMLSFGHVSLWNVMQSVPMVQDRFANTTSLASRNMITCSSVVIRRDVLKSLGGFNENPIFRAVEDYELWLRASRVGQIAYLPELIGFYRVSSTGTLATENLKVRWEVVDRELGTSLSEGFRRHGVSRKLTRALNFPVTLYVHLIDGYLRQVIGIPPRVT